MQKLKTLFVQFESDLGKHQVPAFRGAIIEKVGRDNLLFHNHKSDTEMIYSYPLIQYKSVYKKPALFCLGDGVDEIHKLFSHKSWDIMVNGEKLALKIDKLDLNSFNIQVWEKNFNYSITNWLALNGENYKKYKALKSLAERILMLENILKSNILSFAKGIEWKVDKPIVVSIQDIRQEKIIRYKGIPLQAYDIDFACNVFLPNHIGLGKSASHGFGMIKQQRKERNNGE
jgi:hypothetical protein